MAEAEEILTVAGLGQPSVPDCPLCGTPFRRVLVRYEEAGQLFGYFTADVCETGHDYLTEDAALAIEAISKAKGLFGRDTTPPKPGERIF